MVRRHFEARGLSGTEPLGISIRLVHVVAEEQRRMGKEDGDGDGVFNGGLTISSRSTRGFLTGLGLVWFGLMGNLKYTILLRSFPNILPMKDNTRTNMYVRLPKVNMCPHVNLNGLINWA